MSLAANIGDGCNRLVCENDIFTIDIILYWNGLLQRDFLSHKGSHFI